MKVRKQATGWRLAIAGAVAILGVLAYLIVEFGPWSRPHVQSGGGAKTKAAAESVGAKVTPTEPKLAIEPIPPGPKPAQPANPIVAN